MQRKPLLRTLLSTALIGTLFSGAATAQEELNALVWCDHTDPGLIEPFEKANNVKVNLKEFEGTGAALSILEQSQPGDWDVLVLDGVDIPAAAKGGILAPIPADALPLDDFFPELVMPENHVIDGKTYAVSEAFGYNTIAYNKNTVDPEDMKDMSVLFGDKYKGRIAVYDWNLPIQGLVAVALGKKTAELTMDDLPEIKEALLKLKANATQFTEVVASQTVLATGEVDILFGGGEWLTAVLSEEMPHLDWVIPKQGGLRWSQSIGVVEGSERKDLALKFVQHIVSPEGQAALATSSCYWAMPANMKTGELLTDQQKAALRWDSQEEYLGRSQLYPVPDQELDEAMQDMWTEVLQN